MTSLSNAKKKLDSPPPGEDKYLLADLPSDRSDPLWGELKAVYRLNMTEVGALKNHACPTHIHRTNETPQKRPWGRAQQDWTPGTSASADASRKAAQSFVEEVSKTGFDVFVNGASIAGAPVDEKIRDCPVSKEDTVADDLGLKANHMSDSTKFPHYLKLDVKAGLIKYGETDFQKSAEFQNGLIKIQTAHALDNSEASAMGPFYKPSQNLPSVGDAVYEKTAKVDATSTVAPMDFEMKGKKGEDATLSKVVSNDWQVLQQAVERSRVRLHLSGYLGLTVTFAVTNRSAWCLIGKRKLLSRAHDDVEHRFWRISHASITRLWMGVTRKAKESPFFFLTPDGPLLWNALSKIGVAPWSCRVKLVAMSQSNVYSVSLADDKLQIDSRTIALKVVREDQENYSREVEALGAIAKVDSTFYAIGHAPEGEESPVLFNPTNNWITGRKSLAGNVEWWWEERPEESVEGCVIFMKYGSHAEDEDEKNVCQGVCYSLQIAHEAGILHCDIRKSNVLFFEGVGWRLIDFGLSCKTTDSSAYELEKDSGAQANAAGPRVTACLDEEKPVYWKVGDDYEMAMKMFNLLP